LQNVLLPTGSQKDSLQTPQKETPELSALFSTPKSWQSLGVITDSHAHLAGLKTPRKNKAKKTITIIRIAHP
jgi:hypothetical protein